MRSIDDDGPASIRATIVFRNRPPGLFIGNEKLLLDARNFRRIARLLDAREDEEETRLAGWLMDLADIFQNAAGGMEADAAPRPYDPTPGPEENHGD